MVLEYYGYVKTEENSSWGKTDPFKVDFKNKYM